MPYTLLLADRDPAQLELLDLIFHADGYTLVTFSDGQDVLTYLREHTPDVAILEADMPSVDGFELCRKMKSIKRLREVPVILAASETMLTDETKGLARVVKADLVIPKPLGDKNIEERLEKLLGGRAPRAPQPETPTDLPELPLESQPESEPELLDDTLVEVLHELENERQRLHLALLPTDRSQEPKEMKKLRALVALQEEQIALLEERRQALEKRLARQKEPAGLRRWLP